MGKVSDKIKELKQRRPWNVLLNKYFIAGLIFLICICFIDTNNVGQFIRARRQLHSQRMQIEFYEREIKAMDEKLQQLKSQKEPIEKFAREEYFYHADGEDVYVIE